MGVPPPAATEPAQARVLGGVTLRRGVGASAGLFVSALLAFVAIGATLPVLPTYVRGPLHAGDVAVGIVVGAFAVTSVVCRPLAGRASDRRGRRIVLLAGSLAMALGGLLYLVSDSVPTLVAARLVVGAGEGSVYTAGATWAVDLAPEDRRGLALGLFGLAVWGGLSLGPVAGELLRANAGYDAVFALTAALPAAGAVIAIRLPEPVDRATLSPARGTPLFPRAARRPGAALALANVGYAALAGFVVLALKSRGIGGGAAVFTVFAVAVFASRLVLSHVPDRAGPRPTATAAALLEAAGLTVIAAAQSLPVALLGALTVGAGFSMLFPSLALMVVGDVGEDRRGSALGAFTAFFDIGVGLGGPIAGATAALTGYSAVFYLSAVAALGTAALAATYGRAPEPATAR
ncbi:MAG TPA: MFS transporter [Solirubrobacteraceae bacterium]|jgi:MFS family permease|nr:MFS transporter [Solirubrobacteraceae bacterium]